MNLLLKSIASLFIAGSLFVTGLYFQKSPTQMPTYGTTGFLVAQIPQTTLAGAGATSAASTITLSSFATRDGRPVVMTMLGSIGYGTLEPGTSKEEIISFTGITQNANGSAVLTGVSRGLDFVSPYAASTTLAKTHAGGAYFIISNTAPFYGQQFALINNPTTIGAVWTYGSTVQPVYDLAPTFTNPLSIIDKAYADQLSIVGAPTSTETTLGVSVITPASVVGIGTASTTPGGPYVIENKFATTTPGTQCTGGTWKCIVATTLGKISQSYLDLTQNISWSGQSTFTATTSQACSGVFSAPCIMNGISYKWPSVQGASSTVLTTNGSGSIFWTVPKENTLSVDSTVYSTTANSSTTLKTVVIPANTLTSTSIIKLTALYGYTDQVGTTAVYFGNGAATTTVGASSFSAAAGTYQMTFTSTTTNSESYSSVLYDSNAPTAVFIRRSSFLPYLTTGNLYLMFEGKNSNNTSTFFNNITVEVVNN